MTDVAVLIPVWNRPARARPVAESIRATSDATVAFVVSEGDDAEIEAIRDVQREVGDVSLVRIPEPPGTRGDYARKINRAVSALDAYADWFFQGADDLVFHPGWLEACLRAAETGGRVIGTRDLCNPRTARGQHSTHSLVARSYVEEVGTTDEPGKMLHEGYWHNFVDDELVLTARLLGEYRPSDAVVEHLHPTCGKATGDEVYERALDRRQFARDRSLLRLRQRRVWRPDSRRRRQRR